MNEKNLYRRAAVLFVGILIMGIGVALFKISLMGNDPSTAFVIAIGDRIHVDFSIVLLVMNGIWFAAEIIFGKKYVGLGTFVNWFFVGPIASVCEKLILSQWEVPEAFAGRLIVMGIGVLVLSLSCAMYQTADLGIAPYDALSIMISEGGKWPYFWCRIFTDSVCAAAAFLLGGIVGPGTLVCALGLGPFITFFTKHVAGKLVGSSHTNGRNKQVKR